MKKALIFIAIVSIVSSLASAQLAGYWTFDESSGTTAADSSGNNKTASFYAADSSNYPSWITGYNGSGGALLFNASTTGSGNYNKLNVPIVATDALANLTNQAFTVAMWVRRDAGSYGVVEPGLVGTDKYEVDLATDPCSTDLDGHDYVYRTDLVTVVDLDSENTAQKTLGSWYHYAVTYDGTDMRKYVNGVLVSTASDVNQTIDFNAVSTDYFMIASNIWDAYFVGALDDVAVWTGKYLEDTEIAKLYNGTATPLTVVESDKYIPPVYYLETPLYVLASNPAVLNTDGIQLMTVTNNQVVYNTSWVFPEPNSQLAIKPFAWFVKNETDYNNVSEDISKYGVEWVDSSWNGREPNMAVIAAYITPGLVYGQTNSWYETYWPTWSWCNHPYFRTNIRVAAINANGASVRVSLYSRSSSVEPNSSNHSTLLTLIDEVEFPLDAGDRVWQHFEMILPKVLSSSMPPMWFEMAIVGGDANTVLYIDTFRPDAQAVVTLKSSNLNEDSFVNYGDIAFLSDNWLEGVSVLEPRDGGMLANGDFAADTIALGIVDDANLTIDPTGWTFSGSGNHGLWRTAKRGRLGWYYGNSNTTPVGGDVSAYMGTDETLYQTASATAVSGQTYYAMAYVMAYKYTSGNDLGEWYGWNDEAIMEVLVDNTVKATFTRRLSRSIWRPLYGTYTAEAADAGKSLTIRFSYNNAFTRYYAQSGYLYVGNAYLGTTMPAEWPEGRDNLLANGGFEDLSAIQSAVPALYATLNAADSNGAWFTTSTPSTSLYPNWIYEVPTGYVLNNQGGIFDSGYYAAPIPSPGLNDIAVYASGTFVLGQIVGSLTTGTTYNFDTACGVLIEPQVWGANSVTWPSPEPTLHMELWRIPSGVTDGATINNGITNNLTGYVKIADANATSTGDIKSTHKWQIVGGQYTATSSDTNIYVRIYGKNAVSGVTHPSFVFSDAYISTDNRDVQGGSLTCDIATTVQYDTLGPYNCYQAGLMGYDAPEGDLDSNCLVNLIDFSLVAEEWLELGFN